MNPQSHFSVRNLLRCTCPSIIMMVFTSVYGVVDGLFLSNYTGKTAFAAVNFIIPVLMMLSGMGFMFGSGGSALIGKIMGEQNPEKANGVFSNLIVLSLLTGCALAGAGFLLLRPVARILGAEGLLLEDCMIYGRVYLLGIPATVVQFEFQNLYATAGKHRLGLWVTVASGIGNIVLDALFVAGFSWGLQGAAAATVLSECIGGIFPILYFAFPNSSPLRFRRAKFDWRAMGKICSNGFSELLNNISMTVVSVVYNAQLLRYAGENGLASYGVIMYVNFLFISIFIGYTIGVSPLISYQYGARNPREVQSLLCKSCGIIGVSSLMMFACSEGFAQPVSRLFVGYDKALFSMTLRGFRLYSFCFLFSGFAIWGSAFFTALNNGMVSAFLSFMRTIVFQISFVFLLPMLIKLDGIWLSVVAAEFLSALLGLVLMVRSRRQYEPAG